MTTILTMQEVKRDAPFLCAPHEPAHVSAPGVNLDSKAGYLNPTFSQTQGDTAQFESDLSPGWGLDSNRGGGHLKPVSEVGLQFESALNSKIQIRGGYLSPV